MTVAVISFGDRNMTTIITPSSRPVRDELIDAGVIRPGPPDFNREVTPFRPSRGPVLRMDGEGIASARKHRAQGSMSWDEQQKLFGANL